MPGDKRRCTRAGLMVTTGLIGASLMCADAAWAADDGSATALAELVVTARKREENLQTIPAAVSAMSADLIEAGNFDEVDEFLDIVPNVSFKTDQFTSSDVSIRGSARSSNAEDPSVGIYRDGVFVGGLLTNTSTFYDVQRVEILRGPQGGLYGRNAVGGALSVYTRKPVLEEFSGYLQAKYGNLSHYEARAAVNVPVGDKVALRLSGLYVDRSRGFQKIRNLGQYVDAYDNRSVRARLLFTPTENLELLSTVEYFDSHGSPNGLLQNAPFGRGVGTFPPSNGRTVRSQDMNLRAIRKTDQTQLIQEVNYKAEAGTLTAVAAYRDTAFSSSSDNDRTLLDLADVRNFDGQDAFFGEIRFASRDFGGFTFLAGATYLNESVFLNQEYKSSLGVGVDFASWYATGRTTANPLGIPVGVPIQSLGLTPLGNAGGWTGSRGDSFPVTSKNEQDLESVALFGELNYQLTDAWEVWADFRYTRDRKHIDFGQRFGNQQVACPIACLEVFKAFVTRGRDTTIDLSTSATFENFSPGAGVNYQFNDDVMIYGKLVTGFKGGGFNSLASVEALVPFDSEKTTSAELGAKTRWLDGRLTLNGAVFLQKRKDAIVRIPDPFLSSLGVTLGTNAGQIENKGVELEARVLPIEGLEINIGAGYLDAEFEKFVSGGVDFTGNVVPTTFRYTFSSIARYEFPITDGLEGTLFASYVGRWKGYTNNDNAHKARAQKSLDVRGGVKSETWSLVGYIDNLTDYRYPTFETYIPGATPAALPRSHIGTISPGRTYGVELNLSF